MSSPPSFSFSGPSHKAIPVKTIRSNNIQPAERTEGRKHLMKRWHTLYERLEAYKKKHGHVRVTAEDPDKDLYVWVENLRNNKDTLSRCTQELLNKVGFSWKTECRTQLDFVDEDLGITSLEGDYDSPKAPLSAPTMNEVLGNGDGDGHNDEEEPKQKKAKFDHPYCTVEQKERDLMIESRLKEETKIHRPNTIRNCDTTDDDGTVGSFVISDQATYSESVDHPYCIVQQKERDPKIKSKLREETKMDQPNTIHNCDTTDNDGTVNSFVTSDQATYSESDGDHSNIIHDDDTVDTVVTTNGQDILGTIITFSNDQDDNIKNSKGIQDNYSKYASNENESYEINLVVTNRHPSSPAQSKEVKTMKQSRTITIIYDDDDTMGDKGVCEEYFDVVPIQSEDWI